MIDCFLTRITDLRAKDVVAYHFLNTLNKQKHQPVPLIEQLRHYSWLLLLV